MKSETFATFTMTCLLLVCTSAGIAQDTANATLEPLPTSIEELPVQTQLPELMKHRDGFPVAGLEAWGRRRIEIRQSMLHYQYGSMPGRPDSVTAVDVERRPHESGKGTVESMTLLIESQQRPPLRMRMLMFMPNAAKENGPFPVIIREEGTLDGNSFVPTFLDHDYIFIEYARHDLDPDSKNVVGDAQQAYPEHDWATLAVWAWGGQRVVDYLETRADVDMKRIGITGHSRGGKMALLAGALDERFSLVAPVQSGAGGAGSYTTLGPGAESLAMNDKPHWYADRILMFVGHADRLPWDQHFLKSLVAPRALLCIESVDDDYANPVGTQLTTMAAQPAFDLYGEAAEGRNGITFRNGGHNFGSQDWQTLLTFAEWHFRGDVPDDVDVFRARPYDVPNWNPTLTGATFSRTTIAKGIGSERVPRDNQADVGVPGYATIGDAGNEAAEDYFGMGRFGAVDATFEMAKRQVTNAEYTEFLNAVMRTPNGNVAAYDADMAIRRSQQEGRDAYTVSPDKAGWAVTNVSWFSAARYCNWLHNGKPEAPVGRATTETGAYTISGSWNVGPRNADATFALPNDNEWFKAAYYDGQRYRLYDKSDDGDLDVTKYAPSATSHYGVTGMYDRLWEWNEDKVNGRFRSLRSGAWFVGNNRQAAGRLYSNPELQLPNVGFRVVRLRSVR